MVESSLSVFHSIFDSQGLIQQVCKHYSIGLVCGCKLYKHGRHDTYLLETQTHKYILRIYRHRERRKTAINFELEVLDFLRQNQQAIAQPISRDDGKFITELMAPEGQRYAVLFMYAPGRVINQQLSVVQGYILGRNLANIHNYLDEFVSNYQNDYSPHRFDLNFLLNCPFKQINHLDYHLQFINEFKILIKQIKKQFKQINLSAIPPYYGLCLGNINNEHIHFTDNNQITFLNFSQCGYGWRVLDIAIFVHAVLAKDMNHHTHDAHTVINCFVDGYQDVRELHESELKEISLFVKIVHVWLMGTMIKRVGDTIPYSYFDEDWLSNQLNLLRD